MNSNNNASSLKFYLLLVSIVIPIILFPLYFILYSDRGTMMIGNFTIFDRTGTSNFFFFMAFLIAFLVILFINKIENFLAFVNNAKKEELIEVADKFLTRKKLALIFIIIIIDLFLLINFVYLFFFL